MSLGYIRDGKYVEAAGLGYGGGWCGMPDWGHAVAIPFVTSVNEQTYTAPDDGYIVGDALAYANDTTGSVLAMGRIMINGVTVAGSRHIYGKDHGYYNVQVPVSKGDVFAVTTFYADIGAFSFVPFKAASAGEGLSAAAVKQLRRLNYYSGLKDPTSVIKSAFDAKFGAYYTLDHFRYVRAGNTVQFWLRAEIVAAQEGSGIVLDNFCDTAGVPKPVISTIAEGIFGGERAIIAPDGSLTLSRDGSGLGNISPTWHNNFGLAYITDDPIPGEEE